MSEFWSESLVDVVGGVPVCAICGQRDCRGEDDSDPEPVIDPRETRRPEPVNAVDEPAEEVRSG